MEDGPLGQCASLTHHSMNIGKIWSTSMPNNKMACRVCGLIQLDPPWGEDGKSPN
ncbi:hypothetical protein VINE108274_09600 [Vibrio neptunius]